MELPTHSSLLTQILWDFQQKELFCDVTLEVKGQQFKAHKVILAASSGYFQDIFYHSISDYIPIDCDNVSPRCFVDLLEFMYTGMLNTSSSDLAEVIYAAETMKINQVVDLCNKYSQTSASEIKYSETSNFSDTLIEQLTQLKENLSKNTTSVPNEENAKRERNEGNESEEDFDDSEPEWDDPSDQTVANTANITVNESKSPAKRKRGPKAGGPKEKCPICHRPYLVKNLESHKEKCSGKKSRRLDECSSPEETAPPPYIIEFTQSQGKRKAYKELYGKHNEGKKECTRKLWRCEICDWSAAKGKRLYLNHKYRKHGIAVDPTLIFKCDVSKVYILGLYILNL